MALAEGESRLLAASPLSLHAQTAIAVAEQLTRGTARFELAEGPCDACGPGLCLIRCRGAGVRAPGAAAEEVVASKGPDVALHCAAPGVGSDGMPQTGGNLLERDDDDDHDDGGGGGNALKRHRSHDNK